MEMRNFLKGRRIRYVGRIFILALALTAVACGAFAAQRQGWPSHLRVLTGPNGGQWFLMGAPFAEILSEKVLPTVSVSGGGVENIDSLNRKKADIGFTLNCFLGVSRTGLPEYESIKMDNVSVLCNIYPQVFYFLLRKDFADKHGIDSIETLLNKNLPVRFASLKPATASEFILSLLLKHGYDTSFEALSKKGWDISFNNYAETADNLVAGNLDCFAYTAGVDVPLIHNIEQYIDVVMLPIEKKILDGLSAKFKTGSHVVEAGSYKFAGKPILTLSDSTCLIVRKDLPDDLVSEMVKAIWEGRQKVVKVISDFGRLAPETALPKDLPVHPGAERFWKSLQKMK